MAATPPKKPPAVLPELMKFAANLPPTTPYQDLVKLAKEAGYLARLRESGVNATPGGILVQFDVLVGSSYDTLEVMDTVTVQVPGGAPQISIAARMAAEVSVLYLIFNRLPPPPPQPVGQPDAATHQKVGPIPFQPTPAEEPQQEYVPFGSTRPPVTPVVRTEPDGVPILFNPYDEPDSTPTSELVELVLDTIESWLPKAENPQQLAAFYTKNDMAMKFVADLGTPGNKSWLKDALDKRNGQLQPTQFSNQPRRRSA